MPVEWLTSPEAWIALVTLTSLGIVLGVDIVIFISILTGRLPPEQPRLPEKMAAFGISGKPEEKHQ
jgi:predicted tellurium resistance membrane protein TerC